MFQDLWPDWIGVISRELKSSRPEEGYKVIYNTTTNLAEFHCHTCDTEEHATKYVEAKKKAKDHLESAVHVRKTLEQVLLFKQHLTSKLGESLWGRLMVVGDSAPA